MMAAGTATAAAEQAQTTTCPLTLIICTTKDQRETASSFGTGTMIQNMQGEVPYASPSGKLRFKIVGEKKVLVDRNDDGKLDAADGEPVTFGDPVQVSVVLGDKHVQIPVVIEPMGDNGKWFYARVVTLAWLEGEFEKTKLQIFDSNGNGRFGEIAKKNEGLSDMIQIGQRPAQTLAEYLAIDGKLYKLKLADDCTSLTLKPYTGQTATLKLGAAEGWTINTTLNHKDDSFNTSLNAGETCTLLPGNYEIENLNAARGEKGSENPSVSLSGAGNTEKTKPIRINAGENTLTFGPPFKLEFAVTRSTEDAGDVEIGGVSLVGTGGEEYQACNNCQERSSSLTVWLRSGSKEQKVSTLSYG
jgi:hypothetical protein